MERNSYRPSSPEDVGIPDVLCGDHGDAEPPVSLHPRAGLSTVALLARRMAESLCVGGISNQTNPTFKQPCHASPRFPITLPSSWHQNLEKGFFPLASRYSPWSQAHLIPLACLQDDQDGQRRRVENASAIPRGWIREGGFGECSV